MAYGVRRPVSRQNSAVDLRRFERHVDVAFPTLPESEGCVRHFREGRMDIVSADSEDIDHAIQGGPSMRIQSRLEATGIVVSRYGLVVVLLLIGALKFTPGEAAGIQPLVAHIPLMSWMYGLLSIQGVYILIVAIDISTYSLQS